MKLFNSRFFLSFTLLALTVVSCGPKRDAAYYSTKEAAAEGKAEPPHSPAFPAARVEESIRPQTPVEFTNWTDEDWEKNVDIEPEEATSDSSTEDSNSKYEKEEDYSKIVPEVYLPPVVMKSKPSADKEEKTLPTERNDKSDSQKSESEESQNLKPVEALPANIPTVPEKNKTTPTVTPAPTVTPVPTVTPPVRQPKTMPTVSPSPVEQKKTKVERPVTHPVAPTVKPTVTPIESRASTPAAKTEAQTPKPTTAPSKNEAAAAKPATPAAKAVEPKQKPEADSSKTTETNPKKESVVNPNSETTNRDFSRESKSKAIRAQAIASFDNGRLRNATNLLEIRKALGSDASFEIPFEERRRYFATKDMADTIEFLGDYLRSLVPYARLLISDISQSKGGPIYKLGSEPGVKDNLAHLSHQNGLDADISYIHKEDFNKFIEKAGLFPSKLIDMESQFKLFRQAVQAKNVDRFFVSPNVKKALCIQACKDGFFKDGQTDAVTMETLSKSRPDVEHISHFHLRLKCDKALHPDCVPSADVPQSHGCILPKPCGR